MCSSFVDPQSLAPFLLCRLIALDKNPGVRPIGIGEVADRIVAKAVLTVLRTDIQEAAGSLQLCAGQISGVEAAVHAIHDSFNSESCQAALLIDATNAFNCLNREAALHNIRHLCPSFSTILINTYRSPTELFVDGSTILSQEGTTKGEPLAMPMYALGILPLIQRSSVDANQVWYADDAVATAVLDLKEWWDNINNFGPSYGYYANAKKSWLVVKEAHYTTALSAFHGTNLNITTTGKPHLGAPLGTQSFVTQYVKDKVDNWVNNVIALSHIATTQPHAAYSAFTHALVHKWTYLARTVPDITRLFQALEGTKFIPCLTGRAPPNDLERNLLSLPPRLSGLGIRNPTATSGTEYTASRSVCKPLYNLILLHDSSYPTEVIEQQVEAKKKVHSLVRPTSVPSWLTSLNAQWI